eukprot:6723872-Lingulodinium_polyedra.AAC.1
MAVITQGHRPADLPDAAQCGTSGQAEGPRALRAKFAVANVRPREHPGRGGPPDALLARA